MADPTPNATNTDYLGYGAYADSLWARIEAALAKDSGKDKDGKEKPLGDDPLVVGIFGEWGAGKSKLLSLIRQKAEDSANTLAERRKQDGRNFTLLVPVFFQPWKYEHEKHLHVPMLLHILEALQQQVLVAQTWIENASDHVPDGLKDHLGKVVGIVKILAAGAAFALGGAVPIASAAAFGVAGGLAQLLKRGDATKPQPLLETFGHLENGRSFYEMHKVLEAITRPKPRNKHFLNATLNAELDINFVVFIDDLDRCLPEQAVGTLELIKTIFNVESFAFVLALDDEVIERGIGHRYREYELKDKKPSMPITGFEYLEKIVHVPFRLPALTREEALLFMREYEKSLLAAPKRSVQNTVVDAGGQAYTPQAWFGDAAQVTAEKVAVKRAAANARLAAKEDKYLADLAHITDSTSKGDLEYVVPIEGTTIDFTLAHLIVNSFDAYVPRKLIRVVELFHQVLPIAHVRGRPITQHLGATTDVRIVLAFLLLQLFQPELYRTLRRTGSGFDSLLRSFDDDNERVRLIDDISNIDLLDWACFGLAKTLPLTVADVEKEIASLPDKRGQRYPAQRQRLPIVERLLEHRSVQRHVFDPLKLFSTLHASHLDLPFANVATQGYFSLLSEHALAPDEFAKLSLAVVTHPASVTAIDQRPRQTVGDVSSLFLNLISVEPTQQEKLASSANLQEGHVLDDGSVRQLTNEIERWLQESVVKSDEPERLRRQHQLLKGLMYLQPYLARDDGLLFWRLVHLPSPLPSAPNTQTHNPELAALYADVRYLLGQDDRFANEPRTDASGKPMGPALYLPKARFKEDNANNPNEPIKGFVRIGGGKFYIGHESESDNLPREFDLGKNSFYMARTLTTVDQFKAFVDAGGYDDKALLTQLWDKQGLAWMAGEDGKIQDDWYKKRIAMRHKELRQCPFDWAEQQAVGARPVWGLTWFEARAYARWLNLQLQTEIASHPALQNYQVMLPTEAHWERAARVDALQAISARGSELVYPWGQDDGKPELRANIQKITTQQVSVVGCFAPNSAGLLDLSGNAWEWQNNRYSTIKDTLAPLAKDVSFVSKEKWQDSDRVALRGGSWIDDPDYARCSCRHGSPPDGWFSYIGFRVILSLAN